MTTAKELLAAVQATIATCGEDSPVAYLYYDATSVQSLYDELVEDEEVEERVLTNQQVAAIFDIFDFDIEGELDNLGEAVQDYFLK